MKAILTILVLLTALWLQPIVAADESDFIDAIGNYRIPGSGQMIQVTSEGEWIQFRIRGSGPTKPTSHEKSKWFIYIEDKDHFWVHLGKGRLFYYSWQSDSKSKVEEWTYPRMGKVPLPEPVKIRLTK